MTIPRDRMTALMLLTDPERWESTPDLIDYIPIECCCFEAWNESRTKSLSATYRPEKDYDPISVIKLTISTDGDSEQTHVFNISDGNHRCAILCSKGRKEILANIKGTYVINPSDFIIQRYALWKKEGDKLNGIIELDEHIDKKLITSLIKEGVMHDY